MGDEELQACGLSNDMEQVLDKMLIHSAINSLPEEFLLAIMGGYIGVLFMLTLSMLISAKTRSSVLAVTVPFVILLIPSFLANFSVLSQILGVLPDQLLQISSAINYFNLYQIGGKVIGAIPIILIVYLICYFFIIPLLYRVYKKAEIKS